MVIDNLSDAQGTFSTVLKRAKTLSTPVASQVFSPSWKNFHPQAGSGIQYQPGVQLIPVAQVSKGNSNRKH